MSVVKSFGISCLIGFALTIFIVFIEWLWLPALLMLLMLAAFVAWGWWLNETDYKRIPRRKAQAIERDYVLAKRQMNIAAGQSWRNLVD